MKETENGLVNEVSDGKGTDQDKLSEVQNKEKQDILDVHDKDNTKPKENQNPHKPCSLALLFNTLFPASDKYYKDHGGLYEDIVKIKNVLNSIKEEDVNSLFVIPKQKTNATDDDDYSLRTLNKKEFIEEMEKRVIDEKHRLDNLGIDYNIEHIRYNIQQQIAGERKIHTPEDKKKEQLKQKQLKQELNKASKEQNKDINLYNDFFNNQIWKELNNISWLNYIVGMMLNIVNGMYKKDNESQIQSLFTPLRLYTKIDIEMIIKNQIEQDIKQSNNNNEDISNLVEEQYNIFCTKLTELFVNSIKMIGNICEIIKKAHGKENSISLNIVPILNIFNLISQASNDLVEQEEPKQNIGKEIFKKANIDKKDNKLVNEKDANIDKKNDKLADEQDITFEDECKNIVEQLVTNEKGECMLNKNEIGFVSERLLKTTYKDKDTFCTSLTHALLSMHYAGYNLSKIKINNIFNNIQRIFPKEQPKQQNSGFLGLVAKFANFMNNFSQPKSQLEIQINSFITALNNRNKQQTTKQSESVIKSFMQRVPELNDAIKKTNDELKIDVSNIDDEEENKNNYVLKRTIPESIGHCFGNILCNIGSCCFNTYLDGAEMIRNIKANYSKESINTQQNESVIEQ